MRTLDHAMTRQSRLWLGYLIKLSRLLVVLSSDRADARCASDQTFQTLGSLLPPPLLPRHSKVSYQSLCQAPIFGVHLDRYFYEILFY